VREFDLVTHPTDNQIEKLRLILSTYQDGSGQNEEGYTPGWRDFERAVAAAFEGRALESKYVFDVVIHPKDGSNPYGISCKMRGELENTVDRQIKNQSRKGRISMELSNSAKKFWGRLKDEGIDEAIYKGKPKESGIALIEHIKSLHEAVSIENGGIIDLNKSYYLILQWGRTNLYQLFQFPIHLPDPRTLFWHYPIKTKKDGTETQAVGLVGRDEHGTVFQWYGDSGGQLKYYPLAEAALWKSDRFRLEPLPPTERLEHQLIEKAKKLFPTQWKD